MHESKVEKLVEARIIVAVIAQITMTIIKTSSSKRKTVFSCFGR